MFTDIMVDIETTGTDPNYNNIIQLAAVKFDPVSREVSGDVFDKALRPAPNRFWDEGTRGFWQKMPDIYKSFVERAEDPAQVLKEFQLWVGKDQPSDTGYRFWAKPTTFDWSFVASYFKQFGIPMPFHYRYARDMNSYIAGLRGSPEHVDLEKEVEFVGAEHNALWDCFHQINVLFHAQTKFGPINGRP